VAHVCGRVCHSFTCNPVSFHTCRHSRPSGAFFQSTSLSSVPSSHTLLSEVCLSLQLKEQKCQLELDWPSMKSSGSRSCMSCPLPMLALGGCHSELPIRLSFVYDVVLRIANEEFHSSIAALRSARESLVPH